MPSAHWSIEALKHWNQPINYIYDIQLRHFTTTKDNDWYFSVKSNLSVCFPAWKALQTHLFLLLFFRFYFVRMKNTKFYFWCEISCNADNLSLMALYMRSKWIYLHLKMWLALIWILCSNADRKRLSDDNRRMYRAIVHTVVERHAKNWKKSNKKVKENLNWIYVHFNNGLKWMQAYRTLWKNVEHIGKIDVHLFKA